MGLGPYATLWRSLARHFHDPRLQQLFGRYATYCGASPWAAPATLMLVAQVELDGVWAVEGGMHAVAQAIAGLAQRRGVTLRYGQACEQILVHHGRACGVRLADGSTLAADSVVFNGDANALAAGLLGEATRRAVPPTPPARRSLSAMTWAMNVRTEGFPLVRHNVFFDDEGKALEDFYIPAYIRRYPYMLARLDSNSETMSLCFDPQSGLVDETGEGNPLFEGEEPSSTTKDLLQFCQNFEEAGMRTQNFMEEVKKADLLMDGEVAIARTEEPDKPYVYRGFQMINQEKLLEVRGDKLRAWNQSGLLPLIYAHLFSLDLMRIVFGMQVAQGKVPAQTGAAQVETTA
jgi:hypothetical protein